VELATGSMRIATYNLNGIRSRLDILLRWLKEDKPDVVCLQELKSVNFPFGEIERAGYGAVWYGQKAWNGVAILARGQELLFTRKGLPGGPQGSHSGHIEAAIDGVLIGCLYLPNGNPAPGPKLDYKLAWFRQLQEYADELLEFDIPVVLAGDYNVAPSDLDVYKPERWIDDALLRPEIRQAYASLVERG
jgi:exodeoxyribonuclease-3